MRGPWQEAQRRDKEVRLEAKEMGHVDAICGLPVDPNPTTFLAAGESAHRVKLVYEGYADGYAEGLKPPPF